MKRYLSILLVILGSKLFGQDIEKILTAPRPSNLLKNKDIKLNGNLGLGFSWYEASPIENRNTPFFYEGNGALLLDIFGEIKIPISFSYVNKKATTTLPSSIKIPKVQPFNRFQLKPKYKGFEMQIGTGSMSFSKFTLGGHRFDGLGLYFKSPKLPLYGGVVGGRFLKRINELPETSSLKPAYGRNGFACLLGYKHAEDYYEISGFTAKDSKTSNDTLLNKLNINPFKNGTASFRIKTKIWKSLSLVSDVGISKLINLNAQSIHLKAIPWKWAGVLGLNYEHGKNKVELEYERIDPEYSTFGAYFFNKDIQLITAHYQGAFFQDNALTVNTKIGHQKKNLNFKEPQTMSGLEGSFDIGYKLMKKYQFNFSYSTFSSFTNFNPYFTYLAQTPYYDNIDTLNYRQLNRNINLVSIIPLSKSDNLETEINLSGLLQEGDNQSGVENISQALRNYMVSYTLKSPKRKSQVALVYNHIKSDNMGLKNQLSGPSVQLILPLLKEKLKVMAQAGITKSTLSNVQSNYYENTKILLGNATLQYQTRKQHQFSGRYLLNKKFDSIDQSLGLGFIENTFRLSYKYSFDVFKITLKK
jgi:hypothetical protein